MKNKKRKEITLKVIFTPDPEASKRLSTLYGTLLADLSEQETSTNLKAEEIKIQSTI
jgi:hypothetical protein